MPLRQLRDRYRLHSHKYGGTVYDPTYVYAPWKRWIVIAMIAVAVGAAAWISVASFSESTREHKSQQLPTSANAQESAPVATHESSDSRADVLRKEYFSVVRVVDGDTVDVLIDDKTERLRLIGIDTPETLDPRKPVQCFGKEASDRAKSLLSGAKVSLEQDSSQGERDKYGRLLVYVFLEDGTNFNKYMIAEGYAHEYTYRVPYKYQTEFKTTQTEARNSEKGLWSSSSCSGNTS